MLIIAQVVCEMTKMLSFVVIFTTLICVIGGNFVAAFWIFETL